MKKRRDRTAKKRATSASRIWKGLGVPVRELKQVVSAVKKYHRFWRVVRIATCCALIAGVLIGSMALCISGAVISYSQSRILSVEELQAMEGEVACVLVLGCKVYPDGRLSNRLEERVRTGAEVYLAGIGEQLLMSGDALQESYNEVTSMCDYAIALGVAEDAVESDPYGLSTYESIYRILEEYRGERVVIVTQEYHLYRALYIADKLGLEAYGVAAPHVNDSKRLWHEGREILARWKDVIYALKQPVSTVPPGETP